jgi:hypothetical protein
VEVPDLQHKQLLGLATTADGAVFAFTQKGELVSRLGPDQPVQVRQAPGEGYWTALAVGPDRQAYLLSSQGAVLSLALNAPSATWQSRREPDADDSTRYTALQLAPSGELIVESRRYHLGVSYPFVGPLPPAGRAPRYATQSELDTCAAPRQGLVRSSSGALYASSGTSERPCLMQLIDGRWNPVALVGLEAHGVQGGTLSDLAEVLVVTAGDPDEAGLRTYLAARRADRWRLSRAPLPLLWDVELDPASQRAWLIANTAGHASVLDYSPDEPWRFVPPTLVLGEGSSGAGQPSPGSR